MKKLPFAGLLVLFFAQAALAQDDSNDSFIGGPHRSLPRFYAGISLSYLRNFHTHGMYNPHDIPETGHFHEAYGSAQANGFAAGLSLEYVLGNPRDSRSSLLFKLGYENNGGANFAGKHEIFETYTSSDTLDSQTQFFAQLSDYSYINLDILYNLQLFDSRLYVSAGPTLGLLAGEPTLRKYQSVTEDNSSEFRLAPFELARGWTLSDNNRTINYPATEGFSRLRLGLKAGFEYKFYLRRLIFAPNVYFNYNPMGLRSDNDWQTHSVQAGLDIRYIL